MGPKSPFDKSTWIELYLSGLSATDISKNVKCCVHTVTRHLRKNKVTIRSFKESTKLAHEQNKMNTRIGSGRGFYINGSGYAICTKRGKNKMKKIHRMVMEEHLGRSLGRKEVIHHVDLNTSNNEISNLMLFDGTGDHMRYHAKIRREQRGEK